MYKLCIYNCICICYYNFIFMHIPTEIKNKKEMVTLLERGHYKFLSYTFFHVLLFL